MSGQLGETPATRRMRKHLQLSEKLEPPHRDYMKKGKNALRTTPCSSKIMKSSSAVDVAEMEEKIAFLSESNRQLVAGHKRLAEENHQFKRNGPHIIKEVNRQFDESLHVDYIQKDASMKVYEEEFEEYRSSADDSIYPHVGLKRKKQKIKAKNDRKCSKIPKLGAKQDVATTKNHEDASMQMMNMDDEDYVEQSRESREESMDNINSVDNDEVEEVEFDFGKSSNTTDYVTAKKSVLSVQIAKKSV